MPEPKREAKGMEIVGRSSVLRPPVYPSVKKAVIESSTKKSGVHSVGTISMISAKSQITKIEKKVRKPKLIEKNR